MALSYCIVFEYLYSALNSHVPQSHSVERKTLHNNHFSGDVNRRPLCYKTSVLTNLLPSLTKVVIQWLIYIDADAE